MRRTRWRAEAIHRTDARTLTDSLHAWTEPATVVSTDEAPSDDRFNRPHQSIKHSIGEYMRGMAYTNGIESLWAMLKRANLGVFRHFSFKHQHRNVAKATSGLNVRALGTGAQMASTFPSGIGMRLRYIDLIGPKWMRQPKLIRSWA